MSFKTPTTPFGISSTQVGYPAVYAWKFFDAEVDLRQLRVPNEGLLHVAVRVYDNGDGTWQYEYAVHNLNSDRSIESFSVPLGDCVNITNVGFHDIDYHSGEIIDGTDWNTTVNTNSVTWATDTFANNEWANAIRWGSTYNFWFTADQGPMTGDLTLGLFKPGNEPSITHAAAVPSCPVGCVGDLDGSGDINVGDLLALVEVWGTSDPNGDLDGDGTVNVNDLLIIMANWGCV